MSTFRSAVIHCAQAELSAWPITQGEDIGFGLGPLQNFIPLGSSKQLFTSIIVVK